MLRTLLQSLTKMCSSAMPRQGTQRGDGRAPPPKSSLWHAWLVRADSLDRCRTDRLLDPCCTQETERHGSKYRNEDIIIYIILRPLSAKPPAPTVAHGGFCGAHVSRRSNRLDSAASRFGRCQHLHRRCLLFRRLRTQALSLSATWAGFRRRAGCYHRCLPTMTRRPRCSGHCPRAPLL